MNKLFKTISLFSITLASAFALASCSKKKDKTTGDVTSKTTNKTTNKTIITTKTITTKEIKTSFKINSNNSVNNVSYKLYSINDGEKTLVDNNKEFNKGDKVIIEIINRSKINADIKTLCNNLTIASDFVKSKSNMELNEITINDDIDLNITESNKYYIDFNNKTYINYIAYYYDNNNLKHEFYDDFIVDKNTKVYFSMVNRNLNKRNGYILSDGDVVEYVKCGGASGYDLGVMNFNSEGINVDKNLELRDDDFSPNDGKFYVISYSNGLTDVPISCVDRSTSEPIEIKEGTLKYVDCFKESVMTITNNNLRHVVLSIQDVNGVKKIDITGEKYSFNYDFNSNVILDLREYSDEEYNVSITNNYDDVLIKTYTVDSDNIKIDLKNGTYNDDMPIYFELTNTSKYDLTINMNILDSTYNIVVKAKQSYSLLDDFKYEYLSSDVIINITKEETESTFYKVLYDSTNTPSGITVTLDYNKTNFFPKAELNSEIASGTKLAVFVESTVTGHSIKVVDANTLELINEIDISQACSIYFTLSSDVKIIVE